MSRITRVYQALFGRDGAQSHFGQFGSRTLGTPLQTKDPTAIQSLSAFTNNGWPDAINGSNKAPFLEDMNGLHYLLFRQIAYMLQDGIPDYDSSTPYYVGSIVRKSGTFEQYGSLVDNNAGNALPSQANNAYWQYLNPASIAPGIMADFGGTTLTVPFGWLACDGSAYAQASYPALYTAISAGAWDTFNGASAPGAGLFRVPDMRGRASIGQGQGSGLTLRNVGGAFGEETHTLNTTEMPVHTHTVNDPGHSHTISNQSSDQNGSGKVTVGGSAPEGVNPSTDVNPTGITIQNAGSGAPHNNMQPSGVVTKIIKY